MAWGKKPQVSQVVGSNLVYEWEIIYGRKMVLETWPHMCTRKCGWLFSILLKCWCFKKKSWAHLLNMHNPLCSPSLTRGGGPPDITPHYFGFNQSSTPLILPPIPEPSTYQSWGPSWVLNQQPLNPEAALIYMSHRISCLKDVCFRTSNSCILTSHPLLGGGGKNPSHPNLN